MPMTPSRQEICRSTAEALRQSEPRISSMKAVLGFDGFVDEIIAVVDKRHGPDSFEPVESIASMARKILGAAGESSNYELVVKQRKLGGNGPIMANALASLGLDVTYIGNLGYPDIHLVFRDFAARAKVISIAEPGHTDALEFADGKLMLGKIQSLGDVNWENLVDRVGKKELIDLMAGATLLGTVNWTMLPRLGEIWDKLLEEVFPALPKNGRTLYVDLADPEKRTREDLRAALEHGLEVPGTDRRDPRDEPEGGRAGRRGPGPSRPGRPRGDDRGGRRRDPPDAGPALRRDPPPEGRRRGDRARIGPLRRPVRPEPPDQHRRR